ncbi:molybdate ABC transporter substrate-binding protein [Brevibacillus marinus]|uniref:molybdate ABC transporter substrate-binding protein n=1 Tax=Brevibacillus marinus TaxID=2496837 RepID=UPI000F81736B|nr:molybdate ABC transporter substrate-binding protein [Brevibacillus marinus]
MMKRISLFFSLLCLLLLLFGCSTGEQPSAGQQPSQAANAAGPAASQQVELLVSAAASLTDALQELQTSFEREHPQIRLTFNFGSSGKLAQQIEQGAPADVFLSASKKDMDKLQEKQLILSDSRVDFAQNALVLIANQANPLSLSSFAEIDPGKIGHFAMGEPASVPAGRYTKEVLEKLNLWEPLQGKIVFGSDVRQVLTYVESGNADVGVVYSSDAMVSDKVNVLAEAEPDWHEPIVYPGAIVANSPHAEEAKAFLAYLTSEQGKEILQKYGFK